MPIIEGMPTSGKTHGATPNGAISRESLLCHLLSLFKYFEGLSKRASSLGQVTICSRRPDAVEHALAGDVGAGEGRQLGVAQAAVGLVGVLSRHGDVFGEATVALAAQVAGLDQAVAGTVVERHVDQDSFSDTIAIYAPAIKALPIPR